METNLYTFQDFEKAQNKPDFIWSAIERHKQSEMYKTAIEADLYDRQKNTTINNYVQTIFTLSGAKVENYTASNAKIASNFFHRLNTQRCQYSLGKGVSFIDVSETGEDTTKEALGIHFDHDIQDAAYKSLIHGVTFCFWNLDRLYCFPITEFVPFWDEIDGTLKAGARFWQLSPNHPMQVVLYEIDGYTKLTSETSNAASLQISQEKRGYIEKVKNVPADETDEIIGVENYSSFPIVPLWGSKLHQSTLIGLQDSIDSYDLIRSGFANDLSDVAQVYWIIENAGGMTENELAKFRDRMLLNHIVQADTTAGSAVKPYTIDIPFEARQAYLKEIRNEIYESFGALDVHTVAAGATNDHIDAAYQPMDEEADDFEWQLAECIRQILALQGIEDSPVFSRNRISNQMEQVEMVVAESSWLDTETILRKLPNISPDEVQAIIERMTDDDFERISAKISETEDGTITEEAEVNPLQDVSKATSIINIIAKIKAGTITEDQAIDILLATTTVPEEELRRLLSE